MGYHQQCYLLLLHKALDSHKHVPTQGGKHSKNKTKKTREVIISSECCVWPTLGQEAREQGM